MSNLIIGNAILFLASLIMVSLGLVKNKKQILSEIIGTTLPPLSKV